MEDQKQILHEGCIEITNPIIEGVDMEINSYLFFPDLKTENGGYTATKGTWSGAEIKK